ncbi:MAG: L,D-transpeptidase [Actinomycetota bacterium]|nr:L,D-transpeptidase [Actinomycetota bacterium]
MRTSHRAIISAAGGLLLTAGTVGAANANIVKGLLGGPPPPKAASDQRPSTPPPPDGGSGHRIVYSNSGQRVWLVNDNNTVSRSYAVSGKQGVPAPGNYSVFSKSRVSRSASGNLKLEYMVRFAQGESLAIGFHAIPTKPNGSTIQSEEELGQYRSAGCVRQRRSDAAALWDHAHMGTRVTVLG